MQAPAGQSPVGGDDGPDFRRLAVRIFFINLLVLAAAYSLYWYWVANAVEQEVLQWIARQRQAGQTLDFADHTRGGFPLMVTLTFRDVRYAPEQGDSSWSYHVDGLKLMHPITEPSTLGIELAGSQELVIGRGAKRSVFGGGFEEAAGILRAGGWLANGEVEAREFALIDDATAHGIAVGSLDLTAKGDAAAPPSPDEPGYVVNLNAARIAVPGVAHLPFGTEINRLIVSAEVMGSVPRMPLGDLLEAWRQSGGSVELTRISGTYGPVAAEGTGTLTLDRSEQPQAAFSFYVEGLPELLDGLVGTGALDGATATAIKGLVMVGAKTGTDGKSRVRVPLTLQDGVLTMGPVRLATLPVIDWTGAGVPPVDGKRHSE